MFIFEGKNLDRAVSVLGPEAKDGLSALENAMRRFRYGEAKNKPVDISKFLPWLAKHGGSLASQLVSWTSMSDLEQKVFLKKISPVLRGLAEFEKRKMGDIYQVKNLDDLIQKIKNAGVGASRMKEFLSKSRTVLAKNDSFVAFTPDRHCAAQQYGKGTKWCVTRDNAYYFKYYSGLTGDAGRHRLVFVMRLSPKGNDLDKIGVAFNLDHPEHVEMFDASDRKITQYSLSQDGGSEERDDFSSVFDKSFKALENDAEKSGAALPNLAANRAARSVPGKNAAKAVLSPKLEQRLTRESAMSAASEVLKGFESVEGFDFDGDGRLLDVLRTRSPLIEGQAFRIQNNMAQDFVGALRDAFGGRYPRAVELIAHYLFNQASALTKKVKYVIDALEPFEYDSITDWYQSLNNAQEEFFDRLRSEVTRVGFAIDDFGDPHAELSSLGLMKDVFKAESAVERLWDGLVGGSAAAMFRSSFPISPQRDYNEPNFKDIALEAALDENMMMVMNDLYQNTSRPLPDVENEFYDSSQDARLLQDVDSVVRSLAKKYYGRDDSLLGRLPLNIPSPSSASVGDGALTSLKAFRFYQNVTVDAIGYMAATIAVRDVAKEAIEKLRAQANKDLEFIGERLRAPLLAVDKALKKHRLEWLRPYANKGVI